MVIHAGFSVLATMFLALQGSELGNFAVFAGASFAIPFFGLTAYSARAYFRSIDVLEAQIRHLSVENCTSACCKQGHPHGGICDRDIILRCIVAWFGSIENFDLQAQLQLQTALVGQLADAAFSYQRLVMATAPVLWIALDRTAVDVQRSWQLAAASLARFLAWWLAVLPGAANLVLRLSYRWRARCCSSLLEALFSLGFVTKTHKGTIFLLLAG